MKTNIFARAIALICIVAFASAMLFSSGKPTVKSDTKNCTISDMKDCKDQASNSNSGCCMKSKHSMTEKSGAAKIRPSAKLTQKKPASLLRKGTN
jgi:hypothetical protein